MPLFTVNAELEPLVAVLREIAVALHGVRLALSGPEPDSSGPPEEGSLTYVSGDTLEKLREDKLIRAIKKNLTPAQTEELVKEMFER